MKKTVEIDLKEVVDREIIRKGGGALVKHRRTLTLPQRVRFHDLMEAARIALREVDEINRDLNSDSDRLLRMIDEVGSTIDEATDLLIKGE